MADLPSDIESSVGNASDYGRVQGAEGQKVRMRQYARQIDRALHPVLAGHGVPLILAAAEPLDAIYRSVNSYPDLLPDGIAGNPETRLGGGVGRGGAPAPRRPPRLRALRAARALRDPRVAGPRRNRPTDVARAATFGAVDTLMTDIDDVVPGFVDADSGVVTLESEDDAVNYGVVDEIARRVLESGGRVLALRRDDIPEGSSVAAILRYPV